MGEGEWKYRLERVNGKSSVIDSFLTDLPLVSILVPIRNEDRHIEDCLVSIIRQEYPKEKMEVLIADGMSTDQTRDRVKRYQNCVLPVFLIDNPGKIVPTGMNAALQVSRGKIIIRIDGHTLIAPDYILQCVEALERTGADNVGGKMTAKGDGRFGEAVAVATSTPFGVGGARFHYSDQEEWVDSVYMGAWRREVFERIGLFDEELVRDQDDEFNYRLRDYGRKILLSPKIKSVYTNRSSSKALWKQYFQYGLWKVRVLQKHPRQMRSRQFVPPVFVTALLLSLFIMLMIPWGWIIFLLVAGSYLVVNLLASLITASKTGWRHLALLPFTFAILHISYGLGFLAGLFRFWNRWGDKIGKVPEWNLAHE